MAGLADHTKRPSWDFMVECASRLGALEAPVDKAVLG